MCGVAITLPSTETTVLLPEGDEATVTRTVLTGLAKFPVLVNAVVMEVVSIVELNVLPRVLLVVKFTSKLGLEIEDRVDELV